MKRLVVVESGFCWSPASDSGSASSGDRAMQDLVKLMNGLADAMEIHPDKSQYDAMSAKIKAKMEELKALQLSEADTKQLTQKYKEDMTKASMRLSSALLKMEEQVLSGITMPDIGHIIGPEEAKKISGPKVK